MHPPVKSYARAPLRQPFFRRMLAALLTLRPFHVGLLALLGATVVWASVFPLTRWAVNDVDAVTLVCGRFTLAALLLLPWLPHDRGTWTAGAALGGLFFVSFALQTVSTMRGTAAHAAFLASVAMLVVPFLLRGPRVARREWGALLLGLAGVTVLSWAPGAFAAADGLALLGGMVTALYVVRCGWESGRPLLPLAAVQTSVMALLGWGWALAGGHLPDLRLPGGPSGWLIVYLGVVVTAATVLLQPFGQRFVPARQAGLVFALEPVLAALGAHSFLAEELTLRVLLGGGLLTGAVVLGLWSKRGGDAGRP